MEKKKPAASKRFGDIEAALWSNETEKGRIYNATFSRIYKASDGKLKNASSYGSRDLFNLIRAAAWAYAEIGDRRRFDREVESMSQDVEPEVAAA